MGDRVLAPGEWAVLGLLCEQPAHGWALATELGADGQLGSVWSLGRPLVYRSIEILDERGLIEPAGREPGLRGPQRTVFRPTAAGHEAFAQWLGEPVEHVRDVRSLLLLKLIFADRAGIDPSPMLAAERETIVAAVAALDRRVQQSGGAEAILLRFRLESTRAVLRFVDGLLERTEFEAAC